MRLTVETNPSWTTLDVRIGERALSGAERLVAHFRWLRREAQPEVSSIDAAGRHANNPMAVNWGTFPLRKAIDAAAAAM